MLLICIIPGVAALPFFIFFLPESPHWLLINDKVLPAPTKI